MTMTEPPMPMDDMPTDDMMPGDDTGDGGACFTALLMIEGLETSDGRFFELGSTTWRDTPLPFMVQDTTAHGPDQTPEPAWAAGQLDTIYRDPNDPSRIMARGHMMPNETGQRAEELARHAFRGVSIDGYSTSPLPPDVQPMVVNQDGEPVAVLVRYNDTVISRLTMVPTPAFEPCCVWFDDEQMPQCAADAHGAVVPSDTEPEVMVMPNAYEQLVASAGGPLSPPKDWFFTPEPDEYQPVRMTGDGRLTGHLARKGQCHVAFAGKCETAPESRTVPPFKGFHRTEAHCADGTTVTCGWIAIDTDHGNPALRASWSNGQVWDHYEHSGTLAAKVRASNGKHGIWLSGAVLPGLTERQLAILQGLSVSGHWHTFVDPDNGGRFGDELLAVLGGVSFPGFPETRPEVLVASGEIVGHIGNLDPCDCDEGEATMMTAEEAARLAELEARVEELEGVLVASGMPVPGKPTPVELAAQADALVAEIDDLAILAEPLSAAEHGRYAAKYNTADREKMAKDGSAMKDGGYPIMDEEDLRAAIRAVGRGSGSHNAIRKHIMRRAKAIGKANLIPDTWQADGSVKNAA